MAATVTDEWVEVRDPQSSQLFYANPATGECVYDQEPPSKSIKRANPDGDWWELWDDRHQLFYYHHTRTGATEWTKPVNQPVISLVKVQASSLQKQLAFKEPADPPTHLKRNSHSLDLHLFSSKVRPALRQETTHSTPLLSKRPAFLSSSSGGNPNEAYSTPPSPQSWSLSFQKSRASIESALASFTGHRFPGGERKMRGKRNNSVAVSTVSAPVINNEARMAMHPLNRLHTVHAGSPSPMPTLPANLRDDINQFAIDEYAQKYFTTHKRGLFRRRVPMKEMLVWTKDSLSKPLIVLNKDLYKDAQKCFKLIQIVMGDRGRPRNLTDVDALQQILNCGITKGQLRDEIYVQLCKQLCHNPQRDSIRKGWEIMCIVSITFPPSKNLETYLTNFVQQHFNHHDDHVQVMSRHVAAKLKRICIRGAKGKVLTAAEIERAKEAPFKPSVFGESLDLIMQLQQTTDDGDTKPKLEIPRIIPFLADAVRDLNGQQSEGIFRVPGDADAVTDLRVRIENGNYDATGITDPNVPASLLKYWLRDLADPLIATEYYDSCLSSSDDPDKAIGIVNQLPELNRRIVLYMISFLQEFVDPEVIKYTLMNVNNLAMVFAPNFLRCPSESLTAVFENTKYEQAFLRTLLLELKADRDVCAFDPNGERAIGERKNDALTSDEPLETRCGIFASEQTTHPPLTELS